jgi:lipopolysaccharide/colanic/teichoic acid biosynthesis glycosyltransferase
MLRPVRTRAPATRAARAPSTEARSAPGVPHHPSAGNRRRASRLLDIVVATVALVVLASVMAIVAVLVACTSPGPVLFKQERVGQHGRRFIMLKFRTMHVDCDDRLHREYVRRLLADPEGSSCVIDGLYKLDHDPRITRVGRRLRAWSLDELPQLINVLSGQMALVGPRPALPWEASLFSPHHCKRFEVPPGITGLWQTSGRNRLTMSQALDLDVDYVERASLVLDLKILLRTIPVVLRREGVR